MTKEKRVTMLTKKFENQKAYYLIKNVFKIDEIFYNIFSISTYYNTFFIKILYDFSWKNTIKIWLSAKTQYLSAFSRKQTHQFTTYLLLTNEPWYASFPRYAKIWYSTSVLKQEKIE